MGFLFYKRDSRFAIYLAIYLLLLNVLKNVPIVLTMCIFCAKMNILIEKGSVLYG